MARNTLTKKEIAKRQSKKITVRFQVVCESGYQAENFEFYFKDLITSSVLPALDAELVAGSMEVRNARN